MNNTVVGVVAIDDGGNSTCVVTKDVKESFPSVKGYYGKRNLTEISHKHDFIVEYKNQKYVAGTLAKYDCTLPLQMHTESKQHEFYDLSVLIAIHQYGYTANNIVVSVPIKSYSLEEKEGRLQRLKGSHTISINGISKTFSINDVKVAPETASAFFINEPNGKSRFIDFGSRTIGFATTIKEGDVIRFIDTESDTFFGKGLEALDGSYSPKGLADYVCGMLSKMWNKHDIVYLLGGGALDIQLVTYVKEFFPNAEVMENPKMCNAVGMYNSGRSAYGIS